MYVVGAMVWLIILLVGWLLVGRSLARSTPEVVGRGIKSARRERRTEDRRYRPIVSLLAFALLATATTVSAQDVRRISLDEALSIFAHNNLELHLVRERSAEMSALVRQAAAYPNPALQVTHEPLSNDGDTQSETYFNLSQRVEWPSLRAARRDAAVGLADAARAQLATDSLRLAYDVKRTFVEAAAAEERHAVLEEVSAVFEKADLASAAQFAEGDESGYSLRRMRVERARYQQALALAELDISEAAQGLSLLLFPDNDVVEIRAEMTFGDTFDSINLEDALRRALVLRPELIRAQADLEAASAGLAMAEKERLPEPTVTAGYKDQSNGYSGVFLGASVPLPLFNRNAGTIGARKAGLSAAEIQMDLVRKQIEIDVRRAYRTFESLSRRIEFIRNDLLAGADELLDIARIGYEEGEMSLVELLDAAAAYRDARTTTIELLAGYWIAYYDLLRAAGGNDLIDR